MQRVEQVYGSVCTIFHYPKCYFFNVGTTYQPRFKETLKGEPPRHTVLKTKQTFCVIHGVGTPLLLSIITRFIIEYHHIGTFIYTSYPKITKQGANLTIEVILRAVQEAFERRGVKKFTNIYIQADSTVANKCYVILLALAALLLMGVTDKVSVNIIVLFTNLIVIILITCKKYIMCNSPTFCVCSS